MNWTEEDEKNVVRVLQDVRECRVGAIMIMLTQMDRYELMQVEGKCQQIIESKK